MQIYKWIINKMENLMNNINKSINNNKKILDKEFNPYSPESFKCKCGCNETIGVRNELLYFMNYLHHKTGKYYDINSGFRCREHNKKIGGIDYVDKKGKHIISDHCTGLAVDIATPDLESRGEVIYYAFRFGIPRAIVYTDKKFIHLSINFTKTTPLILFNRRGNVY